jgi:hypothetical protein
MLSFDSQITHPVLQSVINITPLLYLPENYSCSNELGLDGAGRLTGQLLISSCFRSLHHKITIGVINFYSFTFL